MIITYDTLEEGVPSVPGGGAGVRFQLEEGQILVVPGEVAGEVEGVLFGRVEDQIYSVAAGGEREVPGG